MALTKAAINPRILRAKYAVRGPLALKAEEIKKDLQKDPNSHNFKSVTFLNIGNPQQLDQKPLTFVRQVVSLVQYPELLKSPSPLFPKDTLNRARTLLQHIGSVGAYSHSKGIPYIREKVAEFISKRDGFPADPEHIFLSAGASSAVSKIMSMVAANSNVGVLVPVPQYPLYSASSALTGSNFIGYYLDEKAGWATNVEAIKKSLADARKNGVDPKLLVVISPGNPTGSVLRDEEIRNILRLAKEENLTVVADEVYQTNIFKSHASDFVSFKRVWSELCAEDSSFQNVGLVSLHSTSKGFFGECGQRGGYMEVVGMDPEVLEELYKMASIELCPTVTGQVITETMVNPPKAGDESYEVYAKERDAILSTLRERAMQLYETFNKMEGVECQKPQGAMYLFPRITVPAKAVEQAAKENLAPDAFYAMELLKNTGICVVPGSGFGQEENTLHFRTTFLAPGGEDLSNAFVNFHKEFMRKYS